MIPNSTDLTTLDRPGHLFVLPALLSSHPYICMLSLCTTLPCTSCGRRGRGWGQNLVFNMRWTMRYLLYHVRFDPFLKLIACILYLFSSSVCSFLDISPNYSSSLNTLGNMSAAVAGLTSPIIVAVLVSCKLPECLCSCSCAVFLCV